MSVLGKNSEKMTQSTSCTEKISQNVIYGLCEEKIEAYVARAPQRHQKRYREILTGNISKARAVRVKCLECSGWQYSEVTHCQVFECPLWRVRPYQKGKK